MSSGRPQKEGIDYISLDVDWDTKDMKTKLLTAQYGSLGRDIYLSFLCMIGRDKGYYMPEPSGDDYELFASQCSSSFYAVTVENIKQILNFCLQKGLFCKHLFDSCNVLTSNGVQKRYINIVKRRKEIKIWKEIWLYQFSKYEIERDLIYDHIVYVDKNGIIVNYNSNSDINNSQNGGDNSYKGEESIEKKRKEKNSIGEREKRREGTPPQILNFLSFDKNNIKNYLINEFELEEEKAEFISEKYIANRNKHKLLYESDFYCDTKGYEIKTVEQLAADLKTWVLKEHNFSPPDKNEGMTNDEYERSIRELEL
jgi:hypothetical protein